MSYEAFGTPPDPEPTTCPLCDEYSHTEDSKCELSLMQDRALRAERELLASEIIIGRLKEIQAGKRNISDAPRDGTEILILTDTGFVSAWFSRGEWKTVEGFAELDGCGWVCYDDLFFIDIEEEKRILGWYPLYVSPIEKEAPDYLILADDKKRDIDAQDSLVLALKIIEVQLNDYMKRQIPVPLKTVGYLWETANVALTKAGAK